MKSLIEDFLPISSIGHEASREKSLWRLHPFTCHLWWARRPLVACRAAVYGALVPASQFVPENGPDNKKQSLGRANAAKFVTELCKYSGNPKTIGKAQGHILNAHALRLTAELVEAVNADRWPGWVEEFNWPKDLMKVTREDIEAGRAPRPRVLDMFAGGGAIPLEALRLGCEAYALDLNPVAHIIELCTLVYPQKYGRPDPNARGMTGPKNEKGETTWGGLANEVRYWGNWVLDKVKAKIGDFYPPAPDPNYEGNRPEIDFDKGTGCWLAKHKANSNRNNLFGEDYEKPDLPPGYLMPVAYLWTRTVKCKNPDCGATVPLVRQTWLCKKKGRYVALKMIAPKGEKHARFEVVQARSEKDLGFDPTSFSSAGNATCPFCGTVASIDHVKSEGQVGRLAAQPLAIVAKRPRERGREFLVATDDRPWLTSDSLSSVKHARDATGPEIGVPDEPIAGLDDDNLKNTLGITVRPYGLRRFSDLFSHRQSICLLSFASAIRAVHEAMLDDGYGPPRAAAVTAYLGAALDRQAENLSTLCRWNPNAQKMQGTFGRQVITMVWDFCEANPFGGSVGDWLSIIDLEINAIEGAAYSGTRAADVRRGSATTLPYSDAFLDAVITDPPYYDNVPYADISDFFYVWLKRSVGNVFPEHFGSRNTPKKSEAIADASRHGGNAERARNTYEGMIGQTLREASRVLKPTGSLVVVYAHKTTLGWSTLVEALRGAEYTVTEAWPLDTEMKSRLRGMSSSALASSIFLVARKRSKDAGTGSHDAHVKPELEEIVRERVTTLWAQGITGADLVIACVGAGLRAFTRFAHVEYANGEEVPTERFLAEVETVVLETILSRLSKEVGGNGNRQTSLAGVDPATRFYVLWRYTYRWTELDSGEAIVFANGTHVELDGQGSLSQGLHALIEKKKSKYRLLGFEDRGDDKKLGLPDDGTQAPLIDVLHRTLWLMENQPTQLAEFLQESQVNREQMRLAAQALAGPALKGGELGDVSPTGELAALGKLTANWRSVVEDSVLTPIERKDRRAGQKTFDYDGNQKKR